MRSSRHREVPNENVRTARPDFLYHSTRKAGKQRCPSRIGRWFTPVLAISHKPDRAKEMMQPAIGPFSKPASFQSVLQQVFAVTQGETPSDIAAVLAKLTAVELKKAPAIPEEGPLSRRLRRLRYF